MNILIYPNFNKVESPEILKRIVAFAKGKNIRILLADKVAKNFNYPELAWDDKDYSTVDIAISIGGDGTLLALARKCAKYNIPVCGVNIGRLGFLADIELEYLEDCLTKLAGEDYFIEKRLMLSAQIVGREKNITVSSAVNDIVVAKSGVSRMLYFDLLINGYKLASYPADGLIVATSTGSTAYSLSAGGPIVSPKVQGFVVTPICPHASSIRPMVVDREEIISLRFPKERTALNCNIKLSIDGQESVDLEPEDTVIITRSPYTAKIIRFEKSKFYQTLQSKLCIG